MVELSGISMLSRRVRILVTRGMSSRSAVVSIHIFHLTDRRWGMSTFPSAHLPMLRRVNKSGF